jgi:hypothetical protein
VTAVEVQYEQKRQPKKIEKVGRRFRHFIKRLFLPTDTWTDAFLFCFIIKKNFSRASVPIFFPDSRDWDSDWSYSRPDILFTQSAMGCGSSTQASAPGKKPAEVVEPTKANGATPTDKPVTALYGSSQAHVSSPDPHRSTVQASAPEMPASTPQQAQVRPGLEGQTGNPIAESAPTSIHSAQEQSRRKNQGTAGSEENPPSPESLVERSFSAWQPADPVVKNHMTNSTAVFSAELPPASDWAPEYIPENVVPPRNTSLATYSSRGTRTSMANILQAQSVQRKVK